MRIYSLVEFHNIPLLSIMPPQYPLTWLKSFYSNGFTLSDIHFRCLLRAKQFYSSTKTLIPSSDKYTAIKHERLNCRKYRLLPLKTKLKILWQLSKGKLTIWVMLSSIPGAILTSGEKCSFEVLSSLAAGTFLCSASANTFNQVIERNLDSLMRRTKFRPVASGRIDQKDALIYGCITGLLGTTTLALGTNELTTILGALNIFIYTIIYTPLKVITPYNTHIGALVGSIPVLMGCTASGV